MHRPVFQFPRYLPFQSLRCQDLILLSVQSGSVHHLTLGVKEVTRDIVESGFGNTTLTSAILKADF